MYEYRRLTPKQQTELIIERTIRGYPLHSPPHPLKNQNVYLLTATCYEHKCHVNSQIRRQQLLDLIFEIFTTNGIEIRAWVILPNHYHLLVYLTEFEILSKIFRLIHGSTSRQWNLEESIKGRKVWYRYTDRAIRSERHYYTTLNYIHYNPVKHGWAKSPYDWIESSVRWYLDNYGREWLRDLWSRYPVLEYGRGWDDS
ncbi:MAG: transposase [Oscillatoria sp. PMC 1051.18]|nr:transposase [Oscillatoria sp. PMC 1050.18]MEC5031572.1 transposase [Oscillatoria sp. PMC 1051.18]